MCIRDRVESGRDVVGVENRYLGGGTETLRSHQRKVGPGDRQDTGRSPGSGRYRADTVLVAGQVMNERMPGEERSEMSLHRDGTHTGPAAAVRDRERLVQIEVRHVAPERTRLCESHHGVHVRPVDVDLTAVFVNDVADFNDRVFEHAMR